MSYKRINYNHFANCRSGFILIKKRKDRVDAAIKIAKYFREKWDCLLWIAPKNYLDMDGYAEDIKIKIGRINKDLLVISFEDLSIKDYSYLKINEVVSKQRVFCVIDESPNIKNMSSERAKRLFVLKNSFKYKLLLSKDLIYRGLYDIYSQMNFVDSSVFNMTKTQFLHNYMPFYTDDFNICKRWSKPSFEKKVIKILRPYVLVCDLTNDLQVNYRDFVFELTEKEKKAYQSDKIDFLNGKNQVAFLQVMQKFQYFYTICKHKVEKLISVLGEIEQRKEKVIIYTKYLGEIKFLRESGVLRPNSYVVMSGTINKYRSAKLFELDRDIMICTYKVNIPSLLLHNTMNVIYFSQTFDYNDKLYILSRCCGECLCINIYDFWVDTRLENIIKDNLYRKRKVIQNIYDIMSYEEVFYL